MLLEKDEHIPFPVPSLFTPRQAWEAYSNGVTMIRQPRFDDANYHAGGWVIGVVRSGDLVGLVDPSEARKILGDRISIWNEHAKI